MSNTTSNQAINRMDEPCSHRMVVIALLSTLATLLIVTAYPSGKPADDLMSLSFSSTYLWIASQSFALTLPGLLLGSAIGHFAPKTGSFVGAWLMMSVPVIILCDAMTFNWIAERFLSGTLGGIATSLLPALALHVTPSSVAQGVVIVVAVFLTGTVVWKTSGAFARKWAMREDSVRPIVATALLSVAAVVTSFSALTSYARTTSEMARCSTRHPFCAFHIVGYRGVGVPVPAKQGEVLPRLRGLQSIGVVQQREREQLALTLDPNGIRDAPTAGNPQNVIMLVVECLRPEVIDAEVMPNLHAFSQRSIHCANNFSSGNATCQSMFSLVTGLEAVWFRRGVAAQPILNRLLHQAGYELAFYGGQTDWHEYHMDGFVNPTQYDDFQIEEPDVPATDLRAVQRTLEFIHQAAESPRVAEGAPVGGQDGRSQPTPRAALCYLYSTHSRFRYSDPKDRVFQPEASESVLMSHAPELRDQFYNRYKNSLRTMDRMLAPLLREDCVVLVMGDHGEPFLDDGTAIHGTRLSRFQNMTPALIYYPGVRPRRIESPTFHSDLLPTLLSILGLTVSDPGVFDGVDLISADERDLAQREFVTCNFLDSTSMLVGPWTSDPSRPFGIRVSFDISDWQSSYLNPIDDQGYEYEYEQDHRIAGEADREGREAFARWAVRRFGEQATDESRSSEELFEEFFHSADQETRMAALKIAGSVADPPDYLYDLIADASRDPVVEIRNEAKNLVIRVNRYRGRSRSESP